MRRYRIGRADTNDIVLGDTTVSREHAELSELGAGRFEIKDLGSTFGVSVWNGQDWAKVAACELRHDSQLRIGEHQTTVADLLRDTDKTVVRRTSEPAVPPPSPPAPESPERTPRTAPPRTAAPRSAEPSAPPREPTARPAGEATPPPSTPAPEATSPPSREPTDPPRPPADVEKTETPVAAPRPAAPAPPRPAPPRPAAPSPAPPRPAAPRPAAPRPAAAPPSAPRPAAPSAPPFQFLRNMPPEKRTLFWLGAGFAGFLFVSLLTLILVLIL